jgi:hypothetical protein
MSSLKRKTAILLVVLLIGSWFTHPAISMAGAYEDTTPQEPPEKVRIEAKNSNEPAIGYNEYDKNYADVKWDPVKFPADAVTGYVNMYLQEISKPYRPSAGLTLREKDLPGNTTNIRLKNLNSGTIYHLYLNAYHTHTVDSVKFNSAVSMPSNTIKFMTDIEISAHSHGTSQIKIEWDDVWNNGKRIDYKLYISENKDFNNTQPIYITQEQIEPLGPIKINQTTGKLEYIYTVNDPGRVYYIKIAPDIAEAELKRNEVSKTVMVSSYIIARTTKVSTSESGNIWRIEWSPVVTGFGNANVAITYQIYRGNIDNNDVPQYMAAVDDTNFYVTIPEGANIYYYIIRAIVKKNDADLYPGIKIESDKVIIQENGIAAYPAVPEIVESFERTSGDPIITYQDNLTPNSATILWRAPKKGDGGIDTDVVYDIWLINNPNVLDNPPNSTKIASNLKMTESSYITNGVNVVGYKYVVSNLTPNSTYYFKIIASKTFVDYVDNKLQNVVYSSEPALKVIITPAEGPIDQPKVPSRPPFSIKKDLTGKDLITSTTVTIQLKNKWYERFNEESGKWEYVRTEKLNADDIPPYVPDPSTLDGKNYRVIEYDSGVTIDVGCVEYYDGMSYNDIANIPANSITGASVIPNDQTEVAELNPDGLKHNVDITLTNLLPNKTYILWVRAARRSMNLLSGPSDPIVITTAPDPVVPDIKPTVPEINYGLPGDTYVDLAWNFNQKYVYNIKYGTVENINSATGSVRVEPGDFSNSSFYKVKNLSQNTLYFFWIQAEAVIGGNTSEWSDSYTIKTLPFLPPNTPTGFGIKNEEGSVTKNSLTFEWTKEDGVEYILQIAKDIDYKSYTEYKCGSVSEYKVEGLRSNFRYFARLMAYDPAKDKKSQPTQSITVRTERSDDDYDSDQDIENIITGDFIEKDPNIVNNTWSVSITGVNADRFINHVQNDKILDYKIDLTRPPVKVTQLNIRISNKVFKALNTLKENIIITADSITDGKIQLVLRPDFLNTQSQSSLYNKLGDFNYVINIQFPGTNANSASKNMNFKTKDVDIKISASDGNSSIVLGKLDKPIKVIFPYTDSTWYTEGKTSGFILDPNISVWKRLDTSATYDPDNSKGYVSIEALSSGQVAIAELGSNYFDDIKGHWAETSVNNVMSVHNFKSVPGRIFSPDKNITVGEAVKLMLDIMDYNYDTDFMQPAVRARIISSSDIDNPDKLCTREKAIVMVVRLYEIKTGKTAGITGSINTRFSDMSSVTSALLPQVKFAVQNGIVIGKSTYVLDPVGPITRAETFAMLEKFMILTGEL